MSIFFSVLNRGELFITFAVKSQRINVSGVLMPLPREHGSDMQPQDWNLLIGSSGVAPARFA